MTNTSFHEAAHAVTAVIVGMSEVQACIGRRISETGISIEGETVYSFPLAHSEPTDAVLQRRVTATFAGPAWETHSDPKLRPRAFHLQAQKTDCIKAKQIIRCARAKCGLKGVALATWLEAAWQEADRIIETEFAAILAVAEALDERKSLDDEIIRGLVRDLGIDLSRLDALRPLNPDLAD